MAGIVRSEVYRLALVFSLIAVLTVPMLAFADRGGLPAADFSVQGNASNSSFGGGGAMCVKPKPLPDVTLSVALLTGFSSLGLIVYLKRRKSHR